jgi:dCTP deaminase
MGILTGPAIHEAIGLGHIKIYPYSTECINPNSYDLHLGSSIRKYNSIFLDSKKKNSSRLIDISNSFWITPWSGVLGFTTERIWSDRYVPVIDGKSSLGRLFLAIHITAGYGETGFNGQYTLEMTSKYFIKLYTGMRIAQVRFYSCEGKIQQYNGNYTGSDAYGPVASKSWNQ